MHNSVTIIIPTRNRAYTIEKVANSYYSQAHVNEIIFVDDYGGDNTKEVVENIAQKYPHIQTKYIRHEKRKGAAAGRITGYLNATSDYILFGEDDAYLENNYTKIILNKLLSNPELGIVSGRIVYMLPKETPNQASDRFGYGFETKTYLNKFSFTFNRDAILEGDLFVPFTHALFITKKTLLEKFTYDPFYGKGNGFREETDFQLNAYVHEHKILVTNDTRCFHLHPFDVLSGGQRASRFLQFYWNNYYTAYMYDKYFDRLKQPLGIAYPKSVAKLLFSITQFYILFIRPIRKLPSYFYQKVFQ